MKRVPHPDRRPKVSPFLFALPLGIAVAWPGAGRAQAPSASVAASYATRDGRSLTTILACGSTDGTYTAQACGVAGYPLHVVVDGSATSAASAPGTASGQLTSVQGGGAGALPVAVAQSGVWTLSLPNGSHLALDAGGNVIGGVTQSGAWSVAVSNLPATQAVSAASLPLPAGAATAANQPIRNADGGSQVHVMNLPTTQAVSGSVVVSNLPTTQPVSGSVSVSNLPATQPVSGSVSVGNFPASQPVSAMALPLPAGAAVAANQSAVNADGGSQVHIMNPPASQAVTGTVSVGNLPAVQPVSGSVSVANLPATQAISAASLPLPAGAATAANQPPLNSDGGAQVHVVNLPATQAVSAAALPLPSGAATAANQAPLNADGGAQIHMVNPIPAGTNTIGTVIEANRSGAWTDASFTAGSNATTPTGLGTVASRIGLHVWNLGSATVCLNYTTTAAASGGACTPGSVPVAAGSAYLEDQPGNVSPEAISVVCAGSSCPLTIKVR